jgi:hypothetical protein
VLVLAIVIVIDPDSNSANEEVQLHKLSVHNLRKIIAPAHSSDAAGALLKKPNARRLAAVHAR